MSNKNSELFGFVFVGDVGSAKRIINSGIPLDDQGRNMRSILMDSAFYGRSEIVDLLIKSGSNLDLRDLNGNTALMDAAAESQVESLSLIIGSGANLESKNNKGETAFLRACRTAGADSLSALANHNADIEARNENNEGALHVAINNMNFSIVPDLISLGVEIDSEDSMGATPLARACQLGVWGIAEALHNAGASLNHVSSSSTLKRPADYIMSAEDRIDDFKYSDLFSAASEAASIKRKPREQGCSLTL